MGSKTRSIDGANHEKFLVKAKKIRALVQLYFSPGNCCVQRVGICTFYAADVLSHIEVMFDKKFLWVIDALPKLVLPIKIPESECSLQRIAL